MCYNKTTMKKYTFILLITVFISVPAIVFGFTVSQIINHQAPEAYFYPQEFDKLVLDLTIPSGTCCGTDILKAITLQNTGSAIDIREIDKIKLWKDEDKSGFQGMGIDKELGTFIFYSQNNSWYLSNLNETIPTDGLRIFASAEIRTGAVNGTTFQMKIPQLFDQNQAGNFDLGDLGIFLESKNNGPTDGAILNSFRQTISASVIDFLPPESVIISPKDKDQITAANYLIQGLSRDRGGSTPQWLKISINPSTGSGQVNWQDVTPTSSNYATWQYNWQNIAEGTYILKTQSADWMGNIETPGEGIIVSVISSAPSVQVEEKIKEGEETGKAPPSPGATEGKAISEMTIEELKAKITEIQQKIIELLTQLIQLYQAQLEAAD